MNEQILNILGIVWEYRFMIICILAAVIWAIKDWNGFKANAYNLMLQAKRIAKDGVLKSGQEQEEWVVKMALQMLSPSWKVFVGEERMRQWIRALYRAGMDVLDDGQLNNSNKPPDTSV